MSVVSSRRTTRGLLAISLLFSVALLVARSMEGHAGAEAEERNVFTGPRPGSHGAVARLNAAASRGVEERDDVAGAQLGPDDGGVDFSRSQRDVFVRPRPGGNNIFFFEGSCTHNASTDRRLRLDTTQACALESAARANPEMSIFLFSSCPLDENSVRNGSRLVQDIFRKHENVFVWHQSLESLFKNSELEEFFHSNKMQASPFKKEQASNVVRILLLKKYGGVYLDLDFIVRRPLSQLADNFAGMQSSTVINGAALRFSMDAVGRKVADMFVQEIITTFNGSVWGNNGPQLTTRVLQKLCKFAKVRPTEKGDCEGFVVYDVPVFYPIFYSRWKQFYEDTAHARDTILWQVVNSTAVHLWNSMVRHVRSKKFPDQFRDSKQPKMILQRLFCPTAHAHVPP